MNAIYFDKVQMGITMASPLTIHFEHLQHNVLVENRNINFQVSTFRVVTKEIVRIVSLVLLTRSPPDFFELTETLELTHCSL